VDKQIASLRAYFSGESLKTLKTEVGFEKGKPSSIARFRMLRKPDFNPLHYPQ
jgi:hypothetical protein